MADIRKIGSIWRRLALQLLAVAALLSFLLYLAARTFAGQAAEDMQDRILAASATSIADELRSERGELALDIPYSALSMLGAISDDRVFYKVLVDGSTLTGYNDLPSPEIQPRPGQPSFSTAAYRGDDVRLSAVSRVISVGRQSVDVVVVVAQTRLGLQAISARVSTTAAAVGLGFFVIAVALSLFAAASALRPINRFTQAVGRRGPHDLRTIDADAPSELTPLLSALNSFMDRLRASRDRSEEFIAEAAHRIRTPLATVRTQAEIALRRVERPENKKTLREVIRAVDESSRSASQLLDHAMVVYRVDHLELSTFDVIDIVRDVKTRLDPTAELKDIALDISVPDNPCPIEGDPILLQNALRNLLDNSIKYSPSDTVVQIEVTDSPGQVTVTVTDEGRGFEDSDIDTLKQRFGRDPNVSDVVGSGLGLTIADEVAQAHGGELKLAANSKGVGACVSLTFPRS